MTTHDPAADIVGYPLEAALDPSVDPAVNPEAEAADRPSDCRACGAPYAESLVVLDLGAVPAADHFPGPDDPGPDPLFPLSMWLCADCSLAQIVRDDTPGEEPRAVEPQALRDQAARAVALVHESALVLERLREPESGTPSLVEFGSPHGGSWTGLLEERGWQVAGEGVPADLVIDTFGLMHEEDQIGALTRRADRLSDDGVLLLLFHSLATIVRDRQWSALRHGHVGYYSMVALTELLDRVGLSPVTAWHFDLYGGTVLLAATRGGVPETSVLDLLGAETDLGLSSPPTVREALQTAADAESRALSEALRADRPWYAYGAASRAVAVLHRAAATPEQVLGVADASPAKQGRAMPGTRVPIIAPADLVAASPDRVWLLLPDLAQEVEAALPELDGRWRSPAVAPQGTPDA